MKKLMKKALLPGLLVLLLSNAGCSKEGGSGNVNAGGVPHTEVPDQFIGDFAWSQVSSGGYNDAYGGSYSALTVGAQMRLERNGTGTWVYRYDVHYSNGGSKSVHIDADVAYEVKVVSDELMNITIHFIRGKNYEDGSFLHDLDNSKIYPNGDYTWTNVPYGTDASGKIFFSPGTDFTFTHK